MFLRLYTTLKLKPLSPPIYMFQFEVNALLLPLNLPYYTYNERITKKSPNLNAHFSLLDFTKLR